MAYGSVSRRSKYVSVEMSANVLFNGLVTLLPFCEALAISAEDLAKLNPYGFTAEDVKEILESTQAAGMAIMKTVDNKYYIGNVIID